jgi:hypothetical protein
MNRVLDALIAVVIGAVIILLGTPMVVSIVFLVGTIAQATANFWMGL